MQIALLLELFLAIVAIACAHGWASEHRVNARLSSWTVDSFIERMGDDTKQEFVECRQEGDDIARYWLVRERSATWAGPAPDYVPSHSTPRPLDDTR